MNSILVQLAAVSVLASSAFGAPQLLGLGLSVGIGGTATAGSATHATSSSAHRAGATPPASLSAPAAFTAPPYQTGVFSEYYSGYEPTQTSVQPQPKVSDYIRGIVFPLNLTNPETIPTENYEDPVVYPPSKSHPNPASEISKPGMNFSTPDSLAALAAAIHQLDTLISGNANSSAATKCDACVSGLLMAQTLAFDYPWEVPSLLISLCNKFSASYAYGSCEKNYSARSSGAIISQILQAADLAGLDGIYICAKKMPKKFCPVPNVSSYNASDYYNTTVPLSKVAPVPSGKKIKVLHLSDFHLEPRYAIGSESACPDYLCCRPGQNATSNPNVILQPAPRFGAYKCDTPYDLAVAALESIPTLTGTTKTGFNFTIFTGDLVSHDNDNQMGRSYVEYIETSVFYFFKTFLGSGPVYAALGNHDSWPQALNSLNSLVPEYIADQFSWNYNHISALWAHFGWISEDDATQARTHYGGYSTLTSGGLRIITINTDFIYTANLFNYINTTDPDPSGTLRFLSSELQRAEDLGERAWIVGHVLSGWDGSAGLKNPTDLFSAIQARYSPHVLAATFMGHIHDEVFYLTSGNNGTDASEATALGVTWVGPSVTPLTNLNSGFRMYEVDEVTFDVMDSYTWYSNVSEYASLDSQNAHGPSYHYEYSAREAYGSNLSWPATAPLNATWLWKVTEQMKIQPSLVKSFNQHQGRLSPLTGNCTSSQCLEAKVCYMRSSNAVQGGACPAGYSSVQ